MASSSVRAARDRQLSTWVADRNHELQRACKALPAKVPPGGDPDDAGSEPFARTTELMAEGGRRRSAAEVDQAIADAGALAAHQYRDEADRAQADVDRIMASEGGAHSLWRRVTRKRVPTLTTPARAAPVLAAWLKPSGMSGERLVYPSDATAPRRRRCGERQQGFPARARRPRAQG